MYWKVRIHADRPGVTRDRVADFFKPIPGLVFIVYETAASRPHYQGIVWFTQSEKTIRNRITSYFDVHGNEEYSVGKVKDYEAHTRYLCKGPEKQRGNLPDVVFMQALDFDVKVKHEQFWDENERLKKRAKEEGSKSVIDEVIQRVKGTVVRGDAGRREVARMVVEVLAERKRAINMFQARGVFNAVMLDLDQGFRESFIDEIISKY